VCVQLTDQPFPGAEDELTLTHEKGTFQCYPLSNKILGESARDQRSWKATNAWEGSSSRCATRVGGEGRGGEGRGGERRGEAIPAPGIHAHGSNSLHFGQALVGMRVMKSGGQAREREISWLGCR
jgi:hypothetical protein